MKINYEINKISSTILKQINNKRTLVDLYKDIVLVTRLNDIVYQQQHKNRHPNSCLSDLSIF